MPKVYISNAFSLSMLDRKVQSRKVSDGAVYGMPRIPSPFMSLEEVKEFIKEREEKDPRTEIVSVVGHSDTAAVLSGLLGRDLPVNRVSLKFTDEPGEVLIVGQYVGPRLPEGATTLPEGATIEWWSV